MSVALLVDDVAENRYLLRSILESINWSVMEATTGVEALALAHQDPPDIIISDILMPGMDGYSLCREWKADEVLKAIPFWFCTATFTDDQDEKLAQELGASAFIRQPVDPEALRRQIKKLEAEPPTEDSSQETGGEGDTKHILANYANVLARKLDIKVREYRRSIEELKRSREQLDARIRELTFLYELNNHSDRPNSIEELLSSTAIRLPHALPRPELTSARVRYAGREFLSTPFEEAPDRLAEPLPGERCADECEGSIEIFVGRDPTDAPVAFGDEEKRLLQSAANTLCLEIQRRRTLEKLALEKRTGNELLRLNETSGQKSETELIRDYLEAAVQLTDSPIGYLHFVDEAEQEIRLVAWSKNTLAICDAVEDAHYPIAKAGIWADCIRQRGPVVHNDYEQQPHKKGLPDGHVPLKRHMSVPVIDRDRVVMILGVGNRQSPYGENQIATLGTLAGRLWYSIDRQRKEMALVRANHNLVLLRTALEAASHAVAITDADGTIEWVNPAFSQASGYTASELVGQSPRLLKSGRHDDRFYSKLWRTIKAGRVWSGTIINRRKNGELVTEDTSITPVRNSPGEITHFVVIKQDAGKRLEAERRELRSQRMESIGLLAGGVAHDLNNVLAPMLMSIELLREDQVEAERGELVDTLEKSCQRAAGIVRQVLTFARGVDSERVLVQLRHLVKDMVKIAHETFPRNIDVSMDVPAGLWTTDGDPTQLHQVLLNLCINARDALPDGGRIAITGANEVLTKSRTFLHLKIPPGRYAHLCVTDNGTGIPPAKIDRIFEPFFTTKEIGKGTGLGLSTLLGIVKSHDGLVEVDSTPGQGTSFHIYLPAQEAVARAGDPLPEPIPDGQGETILIVDDEPAVITMTRQILLKHGYRVLEATDGARAVSVFAANKDRIALVLTDIMMPVMDGIALTRALRTIDPQIRILAASGYLGDDNGGERVAKLKALGIPTVLQKPYKSRDLLTAVAGILRD